MSRYVDIEPYEEYVLQRHYRNSMGECIETVPLCGLPIADVQEVKHGRWIWDDEGYHCSECFFHAYGETGEILSGHWHYCPNCGAKMVSEDD